MPIPWFRGALPKRMRILRLLCGPVPGARINCSDGPLHSWLQHRWVTALALWGSGFITASIATTLIIVLRGTIPDFWSIIVGNALLAAAYGILWCGARKFDGKNVPMLLALMGVVFWLVASSIGPIYSQPEALERR